MESQEQRELQYTKLKQHDHILKRPDTYVGSTRPEEVTTFIYSEGRILLKNIVVVPALLRIFVEPLSNAIDNMWRSQEKGTPLKNIKVDITPTTIRVYNDGLTIPIRQVQGEEFYIPEMIFGQLLTSSNYNDKEQRMTSGRNGYGVKLTNIFSREFTITLRDFITGHEYEQKWSDNMKSVTAPCIRKKKCKSGYTIVEWTPDFERFGMEQYSEDMMSLFRRYVIDASMTGATITLNGEKLKFNGLKSYVPLYSECKEVQYFGNDAVVTPSSDGIHHHTAFANGVHTKIGGTHVDAWSDAIFKPLLKKLRTRLKNKSLSISDVKKHFHLFVNVQVPNPMFESQSKHQLVSPYTLARSVKVDQIMKWAFVKELEQLVKVKDQMALHKTVRSQRRVVKIKGFDPANKAGGKYSSKCTLILCEGDSAKAFAVKGVPKGVDFGDGLLKGRDWFGIMPLRGKLKNVMNASMKAISKNQEIVNIIQALNLQSGIDYTNETNFKKLNYGRILILCDSDVDGYHIQGLIFNLFYSLYPSLLRRGDFMYSMATQIMSVKVGGRVTYYYDRATAERAIRDAGRGKEVKYYKGLGTSTDKDVKETFGKFIIRYNFGEACESKLQDAFDDKRSDIRKEWLRLYSPTEVPLVQEMYYSDFIDKYLIQYSYDNCDRSLPALLDGLKECQRKILYTMRCGKNKTIKVAQLGAAVATKTHYHHGEQCMGDTIIKMAQKFVGSNNIPLLVDDGQFGSRINSSDAASARYIFTKLRPEVAKLFSPLDDPVLDYLEDEGNTIEPAEFAPIIPMVLVNGANGIATGWSCTIPCYNPSDIAESVRCWLRGEPIPEITPWYKGFTGRIEKYNQTTYMTYGRIERDAKYVHIRELPIGMWIDTFKEELEDLRDAGKLKFDNYSTAETVHFRISERNGFECSLESLKLYSKLRTSNMVLLDQNHIRKYNTIPELIERWCERRLTYYQKRLHHNRQQLQESLEKCRAKQQFIQIMMNNPNIQDEEVLKKVIDPLYRVDGSHEYLLNQPMRNLNKHQLQKLSEQEAKILSDLALNPTPRQVWIDELHEL
jgi:DNA topoisomerase-2